MDLNVQKKKGFSDQITPNFDRKELWKRGWKGIYWVVSWQRGIEMVVMVVRVVTVVRLVMDRTDRTDRTEKTDIKT